MRIINILVILLIFLSISCENDNLDLVIDSIKGFCIKIADSTVLNYSEIDFYDFSTHLIYLKSSNSFLNNTNRGTFTVFVDNIEIYSGQIYPMYSSYLPTGPIIRCAPSFYGDYIIPIGFNQIIDSMGNATADPREDIRIIKVLQKYNQYHEGLKCEIISIQNLTSDSIKIELRLSNDDSSNLYYLDPNKMGMKLFHYFTNGLILRDSTNKSYSHNITPTQPDPWDTWEKDWLSILNSKESKMVSIIYDNFDIVTPGQYNAFFNFPGLGYQVEKEDLQQDNGRIWLGELYLTKKIIFE